LDQPGDGKSTVYDPFLALVADHLTGVTRSQRRALLTAAATSLIVLWSGVMPESLPSLGITQKLDRKVILEILTAVDFYFWLTFIVYWLADYWAWERKLRRSIESLQKTKEGSPSLEEAIDLALGLSAGNLHQKGILSYFKVRASVAELKQMFQDFAKGKIGVLKLSARATPSALIRMMIDVALPLLIGLIAIAWLVVRCLETH
jgi:hypothetical protein